MKTIKTLALILIIAIFAIGGILATLLLNSSLNSGLIMLVVWAVAVWGFLFAHTIQWYNRAIKNNEPNILNE